MAEYIEREAVLVELDRREKLMVGDKTVSIDAIKSFVKNRPAADVAPVVRCRDCKYGVMLESGAVACKRLNGALDGKDCLVVVGYKGDDFCSYGGR